MSSLSLSASTVAVPAQSGRLDYLDATRAFALVLGVVFHASLSFVPTFMAWAVQDVSTSPLVSMFVTLCHTFRMETFFLLAGFLGQVTYHRKGTVPFIRSRVVRIVLPFVVGWFLFRPLLVSGWIMGSESLRGDYHFWPALRGGIQSLSTLPAGLFNGSHLWFLYYLAMVTALTLVLRGVVILSGPVGAKMSAIADRGVRWLARSPVSLLVLVVPTAVALWFMRFWGMDTPDQALRPHLPALLIYNGFFVLGWLLARQQGVLSTFCELKPTRFIAAVIGIVGVLTLGAIERDPGHPYFVAAHVAYAACYALTMWTLVLLTLGAFEKLFRQPHPWVRYVADSSYWMYLVHLPIVVWLQVAVAEWPLHWSIKLLIISFITIAVSLVSYDLFVRSTWVGGWLNGARKERALGQILTPRDVARSPMPSA
jgi:glucans biosynthesis protein C